MENILYDCTKYFSVNFLNFSRPPCPILNFQLENLIRESFFTQKSWVYNEKIMDKIKIGLYDIFQVEVQLWSLKVWGCFIIYVVFDVWYAMSNWVMVPLAPMWEWGTTNYTVKIAIQTTKVGTYNNTKIIWSSGR